MLRKPAPRTPTVALAVAALAVVGAALTVVLALAGRTLPERAGPPIEQLTVERSVLTAGAIELTLRNTGLDAVLVAQVFVNDAFVDFTGGDAPIGRLAADTVRLDYPWQTGQPYEIVVLTSTGAAIPYEVEAAVATPRSDRGLLGLMALLGTYVGIIPVALGMLFLPVLRRAGPRVVRVVLAVTVGLLAFLAVDATVEGLDLAGRTGGAFGGAALVVLGAALAFLALAAVDRHLRARAAVPAPAPAATSPLNALPAAQETATGPRIARRAAATGPRAEPDAAAPAGGLRLALMIAIGIGLHNLGEGLAIGAAYTVGELALGATLVIGFAVHNTTEGLAVVAPLTAQRPSTPRLLGLGLLAGAPAVLGTLIGSTLHNAELSAFLLGVGVGAIVQVMVALLPTLRDRVRHIDAAALGGVAAGMVLMYATGLLVTA